MAPIISLYRRGDKLEERAPLSKYFVRHELKARDLFGDVTHTN